MKINFTFSPGHKSNYFPKLFKKYTFLTILLFTSTSFCQTATVPAGAGTVGDPYQIATLENLYWIAASDTVVASPTQSTRWGSNTYYIQTADIDASATSGWDGGVGFPTIGNSSPSFSGSYDGNGYKISNLNINQPLNNSIGLFGNSFGANLKNINLENANIIGSSYVGGLAGLAQWSTIIDNCSSNASITGSNRVGSLVGYGYKITITNSHSSGTVNGTAGTYVGGLVGIFLSSPNTITNCYSTASVSGGSQGAGGLVGRGDGTTITSSYSAGTVSGTGNFYGGLVGRCDGTTISSSYSTGTVSGTGSYYGGLVGYLGGTVTNSYSAGNVSGNSTSGGFVGSNLINSTINNCYSIGSISGNSVVGGFAGTNPGTIAANCFWNTDIYTNGYGSNSGTFNAIGKTTAQMKTQSTFTDATWDFLVESTNGTNNYWEMNSGFNNGYPILSWQSVEVSGITTTPNIVSNSNIGFTAQSGSISLGFVERNSMPGNLPGGSVTINKYWEVSDITGGNIKLRLYYLPALTASFTGTPKIIHYNGSSWEILATEPEVIDGLLSYVETTNYYSSFSPVTIGDNASPLPVELASFTASLSVNAVNLNWQTATEVNNYGFEVQRSVVSGQRSEWEKVGFVEGNGNSNSPKEYSFEDESVKNGKYSYRLKQIDIDGNFEYSDEIEVDIKTTPLEFNLAQNYPNPFNPTTVINFAITESGHYTLKIYNALGQEMAELVNDQLEGGNYSLGYDASQLASGLYIYNIKGTNVNISKKMILMK